MNEVEIALASWLRNHVKDKSEWTGYPLELLAAHRDDDGKLRHVVQYACLKRFKTATKTQKKQKIQSPPSNTKSF